MGEIGVRSSLSLTSNTLPSGDAPKPMTETSRPVLPRGRRGRVAGVEAAAASGVRRRLGIGRQGQCRAGRALRQCAEQKAGSAMVGATQG